MQPETRRRTTAILLGLIFLALVFLARAPLGAAAGLRRLQSRPAPGRAELELRVLSRSGAPIEHYAVGTLAAKGGAVLAFEREAPRHEGKCVLAVPAREFTIDYCIEVRADGWKPARLGPLAAGAVSAPLELVLDPAGEVRGTVASSEGPLAKARVGLYEVAAARTTCNGFPLRTHKEAVLDSECGKGGRFELAVEHAGTYVLRAEAEGFAPIELGPLALRPEVRSEVRFELGPEGTLEVQVRTARGEPSAGQQVAISRGDGLARSQATDAEGRAVFSRLTPGPWQVALVERELDSSAAETELDSEPAGPIPSNCCVPEDGVARVELWLETGQVVAWE